MFKRDIFENERLKCPEDILPILRVLKELDDAEKRELVVKV